MFYQSKLLARLQKNCARFLQVMAGPYRNKAYIRTMPEEDRIEIKFKYVDPELGLARFFSFNRSLNDNIDQVKERIITNIEKASLKHRKKLKKKSPSLSDEFKLYVDLLYNDSILNSSTSFREVINLKNVDIQVGNNIFHFDIDPPCVKILKLPSALMSGFPIYLKKVEVVNCSVDQCTFSWFKSKELLDVEATSWTPISSGLNYCPSNEDIGNYIKLECVPKNGEREGLIESTIATKVVEAGPGQCPFDIRHNFTKNAVDQNGLRVVTYNILADLYADSDHTRTVLHPYCPPYALSIDYRIQLILKELMGYNADVICLQEVDSKVFDFYLEPVFSGLNFSGIFTKKGGEVTEGMACLFNKAKFSLVKSHNFNLSNELPVNSLLGDLWDAVQQNEDLMKRVLSRTTSCQVVVLDVLGKSQRLVVANTHLYFHPDADHIRLLQATIGLRLAQHICEENKKDGMDVSLLFCGDFNSCPGSGVFELMTQQNIDSEFQAWSSKPQEAVRGLAVHNPCAMGTACGTPPFTNYTPFFNGCLDYIFYEKSKFLVDQVVPLPSIEEVQENTGLPSIVFPSDHIALIADLKWL